MVNGNLLSTHKKAQDMNLIFVIVMGLVIAIVIVAGFVAIKQLNTSVQNMGIATDEVKTMMQTVKNNYVSIWDVLFLFFFIFMYIVMAASAFFIDTHPVFFIISLFIVVIAGFVGGHIANSYDSFSSTPNIVQDANEFTIIPYIFQHYVAIIVIMGMTVTIILFAKIRSSSV